MTRLSNERLSEIREVVAQGGARKVTVDLLAEVDRLGVLAQECYLENMAGREWDLVAELRTLTGQDDNA